MANNQTNSTGYISTVRDKKNRKSRLTGQLFDGHTRPLGYFTILFYLC